MKIEKVFEKRRKEVIIFSVILAISVFFMLMFRYGNDFFWHVKAGEYMIDHHTILKTDVFSWYLSPLKPVWISHEWLFEILLYGSSVISEYGPVLLTFLGIFLLLVILYLTNRSDFHKNIYFTLFWLLSSATLSLNVLPRPFLISNIFLALTLYLLYDLKKNSQSKKIYFIPLIACLWANMHGGASNLSYILAFVFYFSGLFDFSFGKLVASSMSRDQKKKYLTVFFLSILAILINPHGVAMLLYPYQNMNELFMLSTIAEWQPFNFHHSSSILYMFLLASLVFSLIWGKKKFDLTDFIILLMFIFLGFKAIRFWPFAFIAFTYVVFHYVPSFRRRLSTFDVTVVLFSIMVILYSMYLFEMPKKELVDESFIQILKEEKPERLYHNYDYGGYLIYRGIPVFIDGRADMYAKYNYQDSYNLSMLRGPYETYLKKYDFDYFLLDKGVPLAYYLSNDNRYEMVLEKGNTVLYKTKEKGL